MAVLETSAECVVKIDNQEIKHSISGVQLRQFIDDHHELRVRIQQIGEAAEGKDFEDPVKFTGLLGKSISVKIAPKGGYVDEGRFLEFIGVVTEVDIDNSVDSLNAALIIAHSPTISMDGAKKNAQFLDQKASDIIGGIVRKHPVTVGDVESSKIKYKYHNQYGETDYEYINRLASLEGFYAFYDGKEFDLKKAAGSDAEELVWRETLGAFRLGLGTAAQEFTSKSYNYEQKKTFSQDSASLTAQASLSSISKAAPDASKEIYKGSGYTNTPRVVEDAQSLDEILQAERNRSMGGMIKCIGQSNVPRVTIGHAVQVKGMDKIDGLYWVTAVRHIFEESGKYHNTFICTPVDIAYPDRQPSAKALEESSKSINEQRVVPAKPAPEKKPRMYGLHVGIVVDNVDPDGMNRLKVQFAWAEGETIWVRLAVPYAGADRGWVSIPEVGDEVLVGFEYGDPDYPIAVGSLYNSEAKPPSTTGDSDNKIKTFVTRSGHKLEFDDSDGSEKLTIVCAQEKNQIILDASGPSVTIESTGGTINLKAANINLEADQEFKFKAGTMVNLEGVNITIKASGMLSLEGGTTTVKGTPIQLN
jgi:type VI secretion system secreted protein VgrG